RLAPGGARHEGRLPVDRGPRRAPRLRRDRLTMRIAIALGPFHAPPPAGYGAVEKVWWQLAGAFARAGHAVHVVAKDRGTGAPPAAFGVTALPGSTATGRIAIDLAKDFAYAMSAARAIPASDVIV